MADFIKYVYEEPFRYFEFARSDKRDGLADGEEISSHTVTCLDAATGQDCTEAMISDTEASGTRVKYKLKGGTAGKSYRVLVKVVTSNGQKLEGISEIRVRE